MITPGYVSTMAAYNAEMNRRLYAAAGRLDDTQRRADRGAFWGSIHGTLNHLLWADRMWMSRLADWPKPDVTMADSPRLIAAFAELQGGRIAADHDIEVWAAQIDAAWLDGALTWFSGATGRQQSKPRPLLVVHLFNHQTHHRGQVHAMLTAAGQTTGATDLPFILREI